MAEETKPTGETPAEPVQGAAPVTPPVLPPAASADAPVEEWDKERAAKTIQAQREKEKELKAQLKDYERLKAEEQKRTEAQMTETERLKKQADELAAHNAKLQADIWRRDAVAETGLPAVFSERLKGETKEEMLADAKELLKALPKPTAPHLNNTNPNGIDTTETDAQKRERIFGKQGRVFDAAAIREQGGGVVFQNKPE